MAFESVIYALRTVMVRELWDTHPFTLISIYFTSAILKTEYIAYQM